MPIAVTNQKRATLPGENEVDEGLLDRLLDELDVLSRGQGLETATAIAEAVLETLFDGDLSAFRAASSDHATFKALQAHDLLPVSRSTLWYALAVHEQLDELPDGVGSALSLAHHKVLLRIKEPELKLQLARRVLDEGLSKRQLETFLKRSVSPKKVRGRGRPRLPTFVKGLNRLAKATQMATSEPISSAQLRRLDPERIQALLIALQDNISALEELGETLAELSDDLEE